MGTETFIHCAVLGYDVVRRTRYIPVVLLNARGSFVNDRTASSKQHLRRREARAFEACIACRDPSPAAYWVCQVSLGSLGDRRFRREAQFQRASGRLWLSFEVG